MSDGILDGLELNPDHRPQTLDAFLLRLGLRVTDPRPARSLLLEAAPLWNGSTTATEQLLGPASSSSSHDATVLEPDARGRQDEAPALSPPTVMVGPPDATIDASVRGDHRPALQPPDFATGTRPAVIGPHPAGRWKATVPLTSMALALGIAAPVTAILILVLLVLPLLATWGDVVVHRFRRQSGTASRWIERATPPAVAAPIRFVGNVAVSVVRSLPVVALTGALLGLWYGLDHLDVPQSALDGVLRAIGLVTTAMLVVPARRGSPRFRSGVAIEDAVSRLVTPAGRLGQRGVTLWIVAGAAVAGAFFLTPEAWPLPH